MFFGGTGLSFDGIVNSADGDREMTKEEKFRQEVIKRQAEEEVRFRKKTGLPVRQELEKQEKEEQLKRQRFESYKTKQKALIICFVVFMLSLIPIYFMRDSLFLM